MLDVDRPEWMALGECRGTDPALFFPTQGEPTGDARGACVRCSVRVECLHYALVMGERFGVWGGISERVRRRMRAAINRGEITLNEDTARQLADSALGHISDEDLETQRRVAELAEARDKAGAPLLMSSASRIENPETFTEDEAREIAEAMWGPQEGWD